jgi:glycosyltransferase involved in cell wall biosynthesis
LTFPPGREPARRLKITFVSPPPDLSGGQRVIAIYADELAKRGHEVTIACYGWPEPGLKTRLKARLRGRPARRAESPVIHYTGLRARVVRLGHAGPVTDADLPSADIVIATWWKTAAWVADLAPAKGAKVYFMQDYGAPGQEFDKLVPTWRLPFRFVTLTGELAARIAAEAGPEAVRVVRNAVDGAAFFARPGAARKPRVGFLWKDLPTKGARNAVAAAEAAREHCPELQLLAVGARPRPTDLPDWAAYIEAPDDRELRRIYASCRAWLFPSLMEGFGLPILEAMACRTPVVGCRVGAAPDVIRDGDTGYLCEPGNVAEMAAGIELALGLPEQDWTRMSEAARASVVGYGWRDAALAFEDALFEAAQLPALRARM